MPNTFSYDWSTMMGMLKPGTYRITKIFCTGVQENGVSNDLDEMFTVSMEFVIE